MSDETVGNKPRDTRNGPVVAAGIPYESCSAADAALGINRGATRYRVARGWPGYFDVEQGPNFCQKGRRVKQLVKKNRPVVAADVRFESLAAADKALDLRPGGVHKRIKAGRPGYYFVDEGPRTPRGPREKNTAA